MSTYLPTCLPTYLPTYLSVAFFHPLKCHSQGSFVQSRHVRYWQQYLDYLLRITHAYLYIPISAIFIQRERERERKYLQRN